MIFIDIGRRELGKTTLGRYQVFSRTPRIIVDPRAQFVALPNSEFARYNAVKSEEMLEDLQAGIDVVLQPRELQISVNNLANVAAIWFQEDDTNARQLSILLDEAGLYDLGSWDWMMRCSPRQRTNIILTAHRPADVSTSIRALADTWCIFRTTQRHDLDAIEERCGEVVMRHVQELEPYQFVEWDDAKARMTIHKNPGAWFTPGGVALAGTVIEERRVRKLWE